MRPEEFAKAISALSAEGLQSVVVPNEASGIAKGEADGQRPSLLGVAGGIAGWNNGQFVIDVGNSGYGWRPRRFHACEGHVASATDPFHDEPARVLV
jgi:hypothetical protein